MAKSQLWCASLQHLAPSLLSVDTGRSHPSQQCLGHTAIDTPVDGYKPPGPEPCGGTNRGVFCPPEDQWSQARPRISPFLSLLLTKATWGRKGLFEFTAHGGIQGSRLRQLAEFHPQSKSKVQLKSPSPWIQLRIPRREWWTPPAGKP